jgi:hypothetical protein
MSQLADQAGPGRGSTGYKRSRRTPRKLHAYFMSFAILFALIVLTGFSARFSFPLLKACFHGH